MSNYPLVSLKKIVTGTLAGSSLIYIDWQQHNNMFQITFFSETPARIQQFPKVHCLPTSNTHNQNLHLIPNVLKYHHSIKIAEFQFNVGTLNLFLINTMGSRNSEVFLANYSVSCADS